MIKECHSNELNWKKMNKKLNWINQIKLKQMNKKINLNELNKN